MPNTSQSGLERDAGANSAAQQGDLGAASGDQWDEVTGPVTPRGEWQGPIPLSYAQERLWFLDQLGLVGAAYNTPVMVKLEGALDVGSLERSFSELMCRHESLRTYFKAEDGVPHQVIDAEKPFQLHLVDLSHVADVQYREQRLQECVQRERVHRFNLSTVPLMRVVLVALSGCEHVLLLTMHHIVTDGWSLVVLRRELIALYSAFSQGQPSPLSKLPVQYADYAIWQRQWLRGEVLQRQLGYWRERLSGAPPQLELPTDRPRPAVASFKGAELRFELPEVLSQGVKELQRRCGATLFMFALAAYQILLSRWSGQQDIIVGTPIAGRGSSDVEGVIGFFVNTLVLRTELSGDDTFRQLLHRIKEDVTMQAYTNQDLPFEALVKEVRPDRDLARQPIFQVMLAVQASPEERLNAGNLRWIWTAPQRVTTHFDLTLFVYEKRGRISGMFEYATDLFDEGTIERMSKHLQVLLEGIVTCPNSSIRQLEMLPGAERKQVLYDFNDTGRVYPRDSLVHELFEQRVTSSPDAIAAVYEKQTLTYAALNGSANQLAHYLRDQGVEIGEYIPILMPRCLQMLIAQLAILKAGAVYVPLDPALPIERQLFIIQDCNAARIVTQRALYEVLEPESVQCIDPVELAEVLGSCAKDDLKLRVGRRCAAYVMYTSGSTGVPKGVVVPHGAVNRLVINTSYICIERTDCIAHYSNPAFDASPLEIWGALLNGARVLIVPQSVVLEAKCFAQLLLEQRVTILWVTVGLFVQYADALAPVFGQLRYLITGGDVVEPSAIRRVLRDNPPGRLLNGYGPTECATFSTTYLIEKIDDDAESVPIGRPVSNTQTYILDTSLQPVPVGVIGEICIGGAGVALGYLHRPKTTVERFIANPYSVDLGTRLYRSGDLGRWRSDGTIEFCGRNDQQVKLRGYRVELGEIESQLARHDQVNEVVVIAREESRGSKQLIAYLTQRGDGGLTVEQLRAHLLGLLPEYMIPSAFVILDSLPLTQNGKVDRRALPRPELDAYVTDQYEAPQDRVEETLGRIWRELLQVERIGRDDNFFELGGHSLLVLRALFRIKESLDCSLSVRDLYEHPTIRELGARIGGEEVQEQFIDLAREAVLDERIVAGSGCRAIPAKTVLLTGGTGFVGRFLLAQLLKDTTANVYCLVLAPSQVHASLRLKTTMEKWGLWRAAFEQRVVAIPGDLRRPRFGLDQATYDFLSECVDSIYHCATSMNHLETYAAAKPANVESAREMLKLATNRKQKLVNYISTLSIFSSFSGSTLHPVDESSSIDLEKHSVLRGYAASKWVSEKIFMVADQRGIPCNIFRLGLVWADSHEGRYDESQREYRIIKSCLLSGFGIRNYTFSMAPTPVDYVARAILFLANRYARGNGRFHISSIGQLNDVFERSNDIGSTSLGLISHYEWIQEVMRLHHKGQSLPVVPLIESALTMDAESFYEKQRAIRSATMRIDCSRTHRELADGGVEAPLVGDDLLGKCVDSMLWRDTELRKLDNRSNRSLAVRAREHANP